MLYVWSILLTVLISTILISAEFNAVKSKLKSNLRVIGGRDALSGEFPYVLIMVLKLQGINTTTVYEEFCSCACLKPTWTLTASHCITGASDIQDSEIAIKYKKSPKDFAFVKILSTIVNPSYDSASKLFIYSDVGLVKTETIVVSNYAKLSSVDYSTLYGHEIFAVGYGLTMDDDGKIVNTQDLNKTLQVVNAIIIKCGDNTFPGFCLSGKCGQWSALCPGDSGGPVIHSSGIVGINTATYLEICQERKRSETKKSMEAIIAFITPVSPFIDWIVNIIK